jgi:hypothetical protein
VTLDVYTKTNTSSVALSTYDIVVALVEDETGKSLREHTPGLEPPAGRYTRIFPEDPIRYVLRTFRSIWRYARISQRRAMASISSPPKDFRDLRRAAAERSARHLPAWRDGREPSREPKTGLDARPRVVVA